MIRAATIIFAVLLAACASSPAVREHLDPQTSVTVTYTDTPIVLYKDRSGRAAFARDFVNIGPIQVNRLGRYRYYLWLGIWSTVDTWHDETRTDGFERVTVYADGEPILLNVVGWTAAAVGASQAVYIKPVSSAAEAYYEVTIDQIRLLASAQEIRLRTSGESNTSYEMWESSQSASRGFTEFLEAVSY